MKISVISDTHFGYKWNEERGRDAFRNAREAFERSQDSDLIIMPGDVFDRKIPKQEVLDEATDVFSLAMEGERRVETEDSLDIHGDGTPVLAIHGTHERRPREYTNPIELMDRAGLLEHLDNQRKVFKKNGEKVAVFGLSGVPERYAKKALEKLDPEPVEDAFNILVLHQSVEGFVYTPEEDYLSLEDFPEGFDLIVNGHIHWYNLERFGDSIPFILPGSTITTQMNKVEAEKQKGFLKLDTQEEQLEFCELESAREVHYVEIEVDGEPWSEVKKKAVDRLEEINPDRKPLVNLKIDGETEGRVNPRELRKRFRDRIFLNINTSIDSISPENTQKSFEEESDPWQEGKKILAEKVNSDLEVEDELLEILEKGKPEEAVELLKKEVKDQE
ncbi:MAG: exonuclease SbcCD subunit D [Candidatus Nanohaloarchaea archaeon]